MRTWIQGVLALTTCLWLAASASATMETVFTLDAADDPLAFTAGGASGNIQAIAPSVLIDLGPYNDIDCLAGTCDIVNQDWIVFEVDVTSGSVDGVGVGLLFQNGLGMGYFLQGGPVQDGSGSTDTYTGSLAAPSTPTFTFLDNSGTAGLTGTSLILFVAYADGTLPQPDFGFGAVQFMVTDWSSAGVDSPIGNFTTGEPVPEPGTVLLLGMGVLILGMRARRRRS